MSRDSLPCVRALAALHCLYCGRALPIEHPTCASPAAEGPPCPARIAGVATGPDGEAVVPGPAVTDRVYAPRVSRDPWRAFVDLTGVEPNAQAPEHVRAAFELFCVAARAARMDSPRMRRTIERLRVTLKQTTDEDRCEFLSRIEAAIESGCSARSIDAICLYITTMQYGAAAGLKDAEVHDDLISPAVCAALRQHNPADASKPAHRRGGRGRVSVMGIAADLACKFSLFGESSDVEHDAAVKHFRQAREREQRKERRAQK